MRARQHILAAFIKRAGAALIVLGLSATAALAAPAAPRAAVEALDAALLEAMQNADQLGYEGRYRLLEPILRDDFDLAFMARAAVGRGWRELSADEQQRLVELFSQMSIASYAASFDGYGGERFEVLGEGPGPRGTVVVESRIVRPDGDPVALNYVVKETDDGWRIIDVLLDGKFSQLAKQRSEFAGVLKSGGAAALAETLQAKIDKLASEG